jgi:hypothetical protein
MVGGDSTEGSFEAVVKRVLDESGGRSLSMVAAK